MDHNAVQSYYNNQSARRVIQDIASDPDAAGDCQVVEITRNGHSKPQLAILTPFYAEKRTADVVKIVEAAPAEKEE